MLKNHIIMHTHWDREWYFSKEETQVMLEHQMEEVFDFLLKNKDCRYVLDGQTVMIDDLLEIAPNYESKLKKYGANGQLKLGPWYTQTDLMVVSGESIIRNLEYGIRQANEYGEPMLVAYAPDTFGHNAQMPQIYKQFGINGTSFWRGYSELKANKSDFIWEGIDGSTITGINLATGYQGAKYLESDKEELHTRMNKIFKVLDNYSATENKLIMNGHDQMPIQQNINEVITNLRTLYPEQSFEFSDFENYLKEIQNKELELVSGELLDSKHARIHRTINSTRADIKILNAKVENKLFFELEPLAVMANQFGIDYPYGLISKVLKILFGCHAHDSIGGCNSDKVNRDIKQRLLQAQELVDAKIENLLRRLSYSITNNDPSKIVIFNTLPYNRKEQVISLEVLTSEKEFSLEYHDQKIMYTLLEQELIDAGLIDRQIAARQKEIKLYRSKISFVVEEIAGNAYEVLTLNEGVKNNLVQNTDIDYNLEINDGKFNLYRNNEILLNDFLRLESSVDAGDSYDYSPPINDVLLSNPNFEFELLDTINNPLVVQFEYKVISKETKSIINLIVEINKENEQIGVKYNCVNQDKNRRYRLGFNLYDKSNSVRVGMQLSEIERPIVNEVPLSVWEKENWAEKPVSIETMQDYISSEKMAVICPTAKEYEVIKENNTNYAYITLHRSFDKLGKGNLVNRPGRPSGIELDTPDNQMIGQELTYEFKLVLNPKNPAKIAMENKNKLQAYKVEKYNRFNINVNKFDEQLKSEQLEFGNCVISAIKLYILHLQKLFA